MIEDYPTSEGYVEFSTTLIYRYINGKLEKIRIPCPLPERKEIPDMPYSPRSYAKLHSHISQMQAELIYIENKLNEHLGRRKYGEDQPRPRAKGGIEISTTRLRQGFGGQEG